MMKEHLKIYLTDDEREMLYKLQSMRWSSFQLEPLPKIDGEYQKMVSDDLQKMMKYLEPLGNCSAEFSRQQLHINITLLDVLIYSMNVFTQIDRKAQKPEEEIEEKLVIITTAQKLRQKMVDILMPDAWFGTSPDIQRATYSCYEIINGWSDK